MGAETGISWTDSTWNPATGCSKISAGCDNCYAAKLSERNLPAVGKWGPGAARVYSAAAWKLLPTWNRQAEKAGKIRTVFSDSLADAFEGEQELVGEDWIEHRDGPRAGHLEVLLRLAEETPRYPWLRFLLLSKRSWNQRIFAERHGWPATWWQGISVENQEETRRLAYLVPGAKRFLSIEPMLSAVRFAQPGVPWLNVGEDGPMIHWLVAGGESGPNARPPHPDWFRSLRDECAAAGVPFHMKQWGEWAPHDGVTPYTTADGRAGTPPAYLVQPDGSVHCFERPGEPGVAMLRYGKTAAGHILDGVEHLAFPDFR